MTAFSMSLNYRQNSFLGGWSMRKEEGGEISLDRKYDFLDKLFYERYMKGFE